MLVSLSVIDVFTYGTITKDFIFQGIMLKINFYITYVLIIRKIDILNNLKPTKSNKQLALHIFWLEMCNKFFTLHSQIIDYWLLFFLVTTCLNIAVHIVIDHFHRKEKRVVEKAVETWKNQVSTKNILERCNIFIVDYIILETYPMNNARFFF